MKKINIIIVTVGLMVFLSSMTLTKLVVQDLGKIKISVPKEFFQLNEQDIVTRYGSANIPTAVFANVTRDVLLSVNVKEDTISSLGKGKYKKITPEYDRDVHIEKAFHKSSLRADFKDIKFIKDTSYVNGNLNVIEFEFIGTLEGKDAKGNPISSRNYNYIKYAFVKKRNYTVNFSAPIEVQSTWSPTVNSIMSTIEFK